MIATTWSAPVPTAPEGYKLKKKKPIYKRVWFWLLALVALVIVVPAAASGGGGPSSNNAASSAAPAATTTSAAVAASPAETTQPANKPTGGTSAAPRTTATQPKTSAAAAGIGQPVKDGKFQFTVSGTDCSKTEIGTSPYASKKAQGVFCIVSMRVANAGNSAATFDASSQAAFDAQGRKYSASSGASIYLGDAGRSFLEQLNPGSAVDGQLVYDVPVGTELTRMELHDCPFSGGAKVNLTGGG